MAQLGGSTGRGDDRRSPADIRELKKLAAKDRFREKYHSACNKLEQAILEGRRDFTASDFLEILIEATAELDTQMENALKSQ